MISKRTKIYEANKIKNYGLNGGFFLIQTKFSPQKKMSCFFFVILPLGPVSNKESGSSLYTTVQSEEEKLLVLCHLSLGVSL